MADRPAHTRPDAAPTPSLAVVRTAVVVALLVTSAAVAGVGVAGVGAAAGSTASTPGSAPVAQSAQPDESVCEFDRPSWRAPQLVAGVRVDAERACRPDDPNVVVASVLGTNEAPAAVVERSGLARDAVVKDEDRDGDGDPDVVEVTVEALSVNGHNAALSQAVAPGVTPAMWLFAPKTQGIVVPGTAAGDLVRAPSPPIRVEAGDTLRLTVENTHYLPQSLAFPGVDAAVVANGSRVDDLHALDDPVEPGEARTYELTPEEPGTYAYRSSAAGPGAAMGLAGMLVVVPNASENRVQTLNVGGGKVRHPSEGLSHDAVYDLHYQAIDETLHDIPQRYDDVRAIATAVTRTYDATDASPDYFLANGRAFPYTLRESVVATEPNASYALRVFNAGDDTLPLHAHGHDLTAASVGGEGAAATVRASDPVALSPSERATLTFRTPASPSGDAGVQFLHDPRTAAVTTDGIAPGGSATVVAPRNALRDNGIPATANVSRYFDAAYYAGDVPTWRHLDDSRLAAPPADLHPNRTTTTTDSPPPAPAPSGGATGLPDAVLLLTGLVAGGVLVAAGVAIGRWTT
ncbi:multicopper oxidase domain-containing protein [Halobacterium jilantaiense]|uniref:Multicopper oxidase n=1 Tax=Halobacterium jilantaiense TaxID=355548 RepID=A0A1I0NJJ6_9EURY|nr:multicopper oxidase domain-containing protein [Halobacterium jilantaiense]SEW01553.1 Multicopper oxidase [Halobacterium jilantaiense]